MIMTKGIDIFMLKCKTILKLNVQLNSNHVDMRYANYCKWAKIMDMTKQIDTFMLKCKKQNRQKMFLMQFHWFTFNSLSSACAGFTAP